MFEKVGKKILEKNVKIKFSKENVRKKVGKNSLEKFEGTFF